MVLIQIKYHTIQTKAIQMNLKQVEAIKLQIQMWHTIIYVLVLEL